MEEQKHQQPSAAPETDEKAPTPANVVAPPATTATATATANGPSYPPAGHYPPPQGHYPPPAPPQHGIASQSVPMPPRPPYQVSFRYSMSFTPVLLLEFFRLKILISLVSAPATAAASARLLSSVSTGNSSTGTLRVPTVPTISSTTTLSATRTHSESG